MSALPKLVAVLGPTACGKSGLGVALARRFDGEVVSADSRQVYRGLDLGTGKVTPEEMEGIMFAPMEEQFGAYWKQEASQESQAWYRMIYCWQFKKFRTRLEGWEADPVSHMAELEACYAQAQKMARTRYLYKKGYVVWRRAVMGLHRTK